LTTPGWRESASASALARAHALFGRERYARQYFDLYTSLVRRPVAA
jgi:hypothetical protein